MSHPKLLIAISFTILTIPLYAQRYYDADEEDVTSFNKYSHLNLSTYEWISIVIGIVLLLLYKTMRDEGKTWANAIGCIGVIAALPLALIILAIAQKVIGYGITLAVIIAALAFLFGKK